MFKPTKLDAKYAPPLNAEHVTAEKLKKLKIALWIAYLGIPFAEICLLIMLILDDNHPIAENVPLALGIVSLFFIALGAFTFVAFSPIYRRLMNRILELDEGERHLQHQAYSFAYCVIFKSAVFLMLPIIIISQLVTTNLVSFTLAQVDGGFILLASGGSIILLSLIHI